MLNNFSSKLEYYRKSNNLSIDELASKTDLSVSYISLLETGKRKNPSLDTLDKFAEIFKIDVVEFFK